MNRLVGTFLLTALFTSSIASADLNRDLNQFFDKFGGSSNVTSADVYEGQKAGYATGGGVTIRGRVHNSQIATVTLPHVDAGCGGIDIYGGGFSFINKQELVDTLKSIGSSALGYSFLLGLETVSPQVANTIKQLQSWANTINSMNINSCETAASLVGSVWPKNTMASQQICRSVGGQKGLFSDYAAARHQCAQKGSYQKLSRQMDEDPQLQALLRDDYNIAWEAIRKQTFLANDRETAEFFMSLLGTVIVRQDEGNAITTYPSRIDNESFLQTLLEGGMATVYTCDKTTHDKKCLVLKERQVTIDHQNSWIGRIRGELLEIQAKILADQELNEREKELLSKTRLPLYKIVNVLTAYKKGHCPVDLYQVADIVAMDLLVQYLREVVTIVREGAQQLKRAQMYSGPVDDYLAELYRIERVIRDYETRSMQQMEREFHLIQKLQLIESQIASELRL
ncbi:MAG: conjugal transfer protein TraH [Candidatus Obscuribacterales bacterium]